MKALYVIPARGGSKGIPGKNIKPLNRKPLVTYSLSFARNFSDDQDICLTTDDPTIAAVAEEYYYSIPFLRAAEISGDHSNMQDVLLDALSFYEKRNGSYDVVVLLQPTSPIRGKQDLIDMLDIYANEHVDLDMIVSVGRSKFNPYFNLFEEQESGWLNPIKKLRYATRQDCPPVYFLNGSIYIINVQSLKTMDMRMFPRVKKFVMDDIYSVDIDTDLDWILCEYILKHGLPNEEFSKLKSSQK